jgi:hypothetical protein
VRRRGIGRSRSACAGRTIPDGSQSRPQTHASSPPAACGGVFHRGVTPTLISARRR